MCFVLVKFHQLANFSKKQELEMFIYVVTINTNNIFIQFFEMELTHLCLFSYNNVEVQNIVNLINT